MKILQTTDGHRFIQMFSNFALRMDILLKISKHHRYQVNTIYDLLKIERNFRTTFAKPKT